MVVRKDVRTGDEKSENKGVRKWEQSRRIKKKGGKAK